jgi:hypothetical protein
MASQSGWTEADITINGHMLTFAESMTVRVALTSFQMFVAEASNREALGAVATGYQAQLRSILTMIFEGQFR